MTKCWQICGTTLYNPGEAGISSMYWAKAQHQNHSLFRTHGLRHLRNHGRRLRSPKALPGRPGLGQIALLLLLGTEMNKRPLQLW